ncbi:MAG TPA: hypothetical protein VFT90_15645 [Chryseosolibacter sp.]|nr:hypothetical protein [Chryseosolibacter sp.]
MEKLFLFRDFQNAWSDGRGMDAFRKHLTQVRFLGIGRYPTLTFTQRGSKGIMITGYRPFDVLKDALNHMFEQGAIKQNPS